MLVYFRLEGPDLQLSNPIHLKVRRCLPDLQEYEHLSDVHVGVEPSPLALLFVMLGVLDLMLDKTLRFYFAGTGDLVRNVQFHHPPCRR